MYFGYDKCHSVLGRTAMEGMVPERRNKVWLSWKWAQDIKDTLGLKLMKQANWQKLRKFSVERDESGILQRIQDDDDDGVNVTMRLS